jgi:branched-chain amino acid transport system permease protein
MKIYKKRELHLDRAALVLISPFVLVPVLVTNPLYYSLVNQVLIGLVASFGVYIMLRLNLLSFAVPAFMAIGGYAAAIMMKAWTTELFMIMAVSFVVPAIVALPLGALVLRLRGVYFVLVTFVFNEILQLILFETPGLSGGSNGIAGIPAITALGTDLSSPQAVVFVSVAIAFAAALVTLIVTHRFRPEFASIEENEALAESLGLAVWRYRTIAFLASAGVSGLAGFALVNMLLTAHPSSFSSFSAVNYIAYAFVGGRGTMLGALVGSGALVWMSNLFSSQGQYSAGLFGLLLISVVIVAPGGLVGAVMQIFTSLQKRGVPRGEDGAHAVAATMNAQQEFKRRQA